MSAPSSGISGFDVARYTRQIERDFSGHVQVCLNLPVREVRGTAFTVRLSFVRRTGRATDSHYERGVTGVWPSHSARTFFGLLLRLHIELDKLLSEEKAVAERWVQDRFAD